MRVILPLLLLAALLAGCGKEDGPESEQSDKPVEYETYVSSDYAFSIDYLESFIETPVPAGSLPAGTLFARVWKLESAGDAIPAATNIGVYDRSVNWPELSEREAARRLLKAVKKELLAAGDPNVIGVRFEDERIIEVGGWPCAFYRLNRQLDGFDVVETNYLIVGPQFVYQLMFAASPEDYPAQLPVIEHMVGSFKLTGE